MIVVAILASFAAVYLLQETAQENGAISANLIKRFASLAMFIFSGVLLSLEYGTLRGVFILIGVVSLLGTIFTLLRYKLQRAE